MGLSINLRSDLAKLRDDELAERLEQAWLAYNTSEYCTPADARIWYSRRGLVRHPWAYRFLSVLGVSSQGGFSFGFGPFVRIGYMDMHLNLCEIRDIQDEIARRNNAKQVRVS
jgi:hypothetical protein